MGSIETPVPASAPFSLQGKVALVTGSGRGIGAAMATELARCGAKVVVNYAKSAAAADKVVQRIKALGSDAVAIQADVSKVPETKRLFEEASKPFGQLDIVCSNAGVVSFGHLEDVTEVESSAAISLLSPKYSDELSRRNSIECLTLTLAVNFSWRSKPTSI